MTGCQAGGDGPREPESTALDLVLEPVTVIGEIEGPADYVFGDVRAVAVDDQGHVYVGARIGATVRVYSARGEFITGGAV